MTKPSSDVKRPNLRHPERPDLHSIKVVQGCVLLGENQRRNCGVLHDVSGISNVCVLYAHVHKQLSLNGLEEFLKQIGIVGFCCISVFGARLFEFGSLLNMRGGRRMWVWG